MSADTVLEEGGGSLGLSSILMGRHHIDRADHWRRRRIACPLEKRPAAEETLFDSKLADRTEKSAPAKKIPVVKKKSQSSKNYRDRNNF